MSEFENVRSFERHETLERRTFLSYADLIEALQYGVERSEELEEIEEQLSMIELALQPIRYPQRVDDLKAIKQELPRARPTEIEAAELINQAIHLILEDWREDIKTVADEADKEVKAFSGVLAIGKTVGPLKKLDGIVLNPAYLTENGLAWVSDGDMHVFSAQDQLFIDTGNLPDEARAALKQYGEATSRKLPGDDA